MSFLEIKNISKDLDNFEVLNNISFDVSSGERLSIVGPSGCGKSTLLSIIAGHLKPDKGEIILCGENVSSYNKNIALMPQQDMLLDWYSILDNVSLPLKLSGMTKNNAREEAFKYFEEFGLLGFEKVYPSQLSGGMKQRAAMLRTFLSKAKILLLDEPFGALDAITRSQMQDFIIEKQDQINTFILVTHDIEEALFMSDRILVMSGRPSKINLDLNLPNKKNREWLNSIESFEAKKKILSSLFF